MLEEDTATNKNKLKKHKNNVRKFIFYHFSNELHYSFNLQFYNNNTFTIAGTIKTTTTTTISINMKMVPTDFHITATFKRFFYFFMSYTCADLSFMSVRYLNGSQLIVSLLNKIVRRTTTVNVFIYLKLYHYDHKPNGSLTTMVVHRKKCRGGGSNVIL